MTLDEVIDELHYWNTCDEYPETFYDDEVTRDALHYLKWFRARDNMSRKLDREDNEPLTWEDLKQLQGKPVWVESHGDITEFTGWAIVRNALEDRAHFIFSHYDGEFLTYEMALPDVTFGKEWNVYRKER